MGKTVVACYSTRGRLVKIYNSAAEASRSRNLHSRTIDKAIRGEFLTVDNLMWRRFPSGDVPASIPPLQNRSISTQFRPIGKLDESGQIIDTYPSINEASKANNISIPSLRKNLNNKYHEVGKAKYRYLNEDEIEKYGYQKGKKINHKKVTVFQYDLNGTFIKSYPSIRAAAKAMGNARRTQEIRDCLNGKYKTAFGYIWKKQISKNEYCF